FARPDAETPVECLLPSVGVRNLVCTRARVAGVARRADILAGGFAEHLRERLAEYGIPRGVMSAVPFVRIIEHVRRVQLAKEIGNVAVRSPDNCIGVDTRLSPLGDAVSAKPLLFDRFGGFWQLAWVPAF